MKSNYNPFKYKEGGTSAGVPVDSEEYRRLAEMHGEIKSDDANWYERNIVRPSVTWLNTRPGGPFVTILKTAASFIPGVGEALDIAEGDPGWATLGAIPIVGDSVQAGRRVVKEAAPIVSKASKELGPTLTELHDEFYNAANDTYRYVSDILKRYSVSADALKNKKRADKIQETVPTGMFTKENIKHKSDIAHTYKFNKNMETGQTDVLLNTFSGRDMAYAGTRAGSELALMKHLGSSYSNSMFFPTELNLLFKDKNNITNMSRLISLKRMSGIDKPFTKLTDAEIEEIVKKGYGTKMFWVKKSGGIPESASEVSKRVSPVIKNIHIWFQLLLEELWY